MIVLINALSFVKERNLHGNLPDHNPGRAHIQYYILSAVQTGVELNQCMNRRLTQSKVAESLMTVEMQKIIKTYDHNSLHFFHHKVK